MTALVPDADVPELDGDGLLRYRGRWVATSRQEEVALRPLLLRWRRMVPQDSLVQATWNQPVASTAMSSLILRLRRRIQPLGLTIQTIRARGFVLEPAPVSTRKGSPWPMS